MKKIRKNIAIMLVLMMSVTLLHTVSVNKSVKAAEEFAIVSPTNNQLKASGYIDIQWNAATSKTVQEYQVYVDDTLVGTTTDTSYEYYTTKVKAFTTYVKAKFTDGTSLNTDKITFGVTKKGLGLATDMGANIDLRELGCGWYYNWGTGPSSGTQYRDIEYVPMVWKETDATNFKNRVQAFKDQGYKYVLTFNEPDLAGQCDMPMEDVYNVWQGIEDMSGIKISSPVTALWPNASTEWFQPFMTKVDENGDYQPDFISIHCYPDDWAGAGMAEWFLETVVDWTWETYGLPIWITEFSTTGQWVTATGDNGTKEFWEAVMPGLDEREYVERYAAFGFNAADNANVGLWNYSTGELTAGGEVYKTLGNPEEFTQEDPEWEYDYTMSTRDTLLDDSININETVYEDYVNYEGVVASASSGEDSAARAIDGDVGSRWESEHDVDPQSIVIDLGQVRNIKQINIIWETASASTYTVEVSDDNVNFTEIALVEGGTDTQNRLDEVVLKEMVSGRYVKINGTARTTGYGYSIYDMAIYGADTLDEEIVISSDIKIEGFQINTTYEGSRTVASVEPTIDEKAVETWGFVYGLASVNGVETGITDEDIKLGVDNDYVRAYESTSVGTLTGNYGDSKTATYYARTMSFGTKNKVAFTAGYKIRAYALLEDGSYVYSDVGSYTVYEVADKLYQTNKFNTLEAHNYAYNTILTLINPDYVEVDYVWNNTIVTPQ